MRKPDTDENNVQMSDVLCDFCHREWTEDLPMVEGHQGSCICGNCLTMAYSEVVVDKAPPSIGDFRCALCLETSDDRAALKRKDEPGWRSPAHADAAICKRCVRQTAGVLQNDKECGWKKPG